MCRSICGSQGTQFAPLSRSSPLVSKDGSDHYLVNITVECTTDHCYWKLKILSNYMQCTSTSGMKTKNIVSIFITLDIIIHQVYLWFVQQFWRSLEGHLSHFAFKQVITLFHYNEGVIKDIKRNERLIWTFHNVSSQNDAVIHIM